MNLILKCALGATAVALALPAAARVTFYEGDGFRGRAFTTDKPVANLQRAGYNDSASSVIVERGRWEVCEDARFGGKCMVLRPGSYDSLGRVGINNRISSVRPASAKRRYDNEASVPTAVSAYEYRRRPNERVYEARVTSVRAVMGPPEQRCWVDRQQVSDRGERNVGGAVLGAILGGVLGHQVGSGRGNDAATVGGAIAGGVIGSNVGRDGHNEYGRDVRRCERVDSGTPAYWDVTYNYKGRDHRIQTSTPPGDTIAVNRNGEPRG